MGAKAYLIRKCHGAVHLSQLMHVTKDWWKVRQHRRRGVPLPPVRLRNGLVLHHGEHDNPLLMLDEVFINLSYQLEALPPARANMVDIGANIGAVTLFWARLSPTLSIHAYEPNPSTFDTLRRNIAENSVQDRVLPFPEAVGRQAGELRLWVDIRSDLSSGYLDVSPSPGEEGRRISVPMVGLDEVWKRLNKQQSWLLKIDTEGAEADILEGASKEVLAATQNVIVEYHDEICGGASARCRRVLDVAGFQYRIELNPFIPNDEGIFYASRGQDVQARTALA